MPLLCGPNNGDHRHVCTLECADSHHCGQSWPSSSSTLPTSGQGSDFEDFTILKFKFLTEHGYPLNQSYTHTYSATSLGLEQVVVMPCHQMDHVIYELSDSRQFLQVHASEVPGLTSAAATQHDIGRLGSSERVWGWVLLSDPSIFKHVALIITVLQPMLRSASAM